MWRGVLSAQTSLRTHPESDLFLPRPPPWGPAAIMFPLHYCSSHHRITPLLRPARTILLNISQVLLFLHLKSSEGCLVT